jgi:hypothetical protein
VHDGEAAGCITINILKSHPEFSPEQNIRISIIHFRTALLCIPLLAVAVPAGLLFVSF